MPPLLPHIIPRPPSPTRTINILHSNALERSPQLNSKSTEINRFVFHHSTSPMLFNPTIHRTSDTFLNTHISDRFVLPPLERGTAHPYRTSRISRTGRTAQRTPARFWKIHPPQPIPEVRGCTPCGCPLRSHRSRGVAPMTRGSAGTYILDPLGLAESLSVKSNTDISDL